MRNESEGKIVQDFLRQELKEHDQYSFETIYLVRAFYRWIRWKVLQRCYKHAWDAAMRCKVQEWLTDQTLDRSDAMPDNFQKFLEEDLGEVPPKDDG